QALTHEAERLGTTFQPGEDTPKKVLEDIARARTVIITPSDPKVLLSAARTAYERGDLDEAEKMAKQADQAGTVWSSMSHLWSDSPSKVLRDVAAARGRMAMAAAPAKEPSTKESSTSFTALKAFMGKNDNVVAAAADQPQSAPQVPRKPNSSDQPQSTPQVPRKPNPSDQPQSTP